MTPAPLGDPIIEDGKDGPPSCLLTMRTKGDEEQILVLTAGNCSSGGGWPSPVALALPGDADPGAVDIGHPTSGWPSRSWPLSTIVAESMVMVMVMVMVGSCRMIVAMPWWSDAAGCICWCWDDGPC